MIADVELMKFCRINKQGIPYEVIDAAIADEVISNHNIMVIAGQPWIYQSGVFRQDKDGLLVQHYVRNLIIRNLRNDTRATRIYRSKYG